MLCMTKYDRPYIEDCRARLDEQVASYRAVANAATECAQAALTKAVHDIEIGRVAEVGTEILDGWVVDEIKQVDKTIDEKSVPYEVWVRPRLTH